MRAVAVVVAWATVCGGGPAMAALADGDPCLAPVSHNAGPITLRDARITVRDEPGLNGGAARQTSVQVQACAVIAMPGNPVAYAIGYQAVIYSTDGRQLAASLGVARNFRADRLSGGVAHVALSDTISIGYAVDHAKLARTLVLAKLNVATCDTNGQCTPSTYLGRVEMPACFVDGEGKPPHDCRAQQQ